MVGVLAKCEAVQGTSGILSFEDDDLSMYVYW